ncbi:peptidoglycan-binding domain-containing protein [Streptomyces sp. NRRL S-350]|uniref:peptidoglycan-binding domain-containing protein n=1 Tax=Streptomyces sp. NRRL S-350 TaxID=1463902 RepID=UPI0004BECF5D|nr:peptidoglycan-binding domain-containing protein [Streptomyces sp. NRRL S-350]
MRNRLVGGLVTAGLVLAAGIATAPTASAQASQYCGYTSAQPTLRYGNTGDAVKQLQCELNHVTYSSWNSSLDEDGVWGSATDSAVWRFQRCTGLSQDGVVGPMTWDKVNGWVLTHGSINC